jgi:hypothetical protein
LELLAGERHDAETNWRRRRRGDEADDDAAAPAVLGYAVVAVLSLTSERPELGRGRAHGWRRTERAEQDEVVGDVGGALLEVTGKLGDVQLLQRGVGHGRASRADREGKRSGGDRQRRC